MKNILEKIVTPPKNEQIETLINGDLDDLANKYAPNLTEEDDKLIDQETGSYWSPFFTVTRSEILSYVKEHYSLEDLGLFKKKGEDSYYYLEKIGDKYKSHSWDYETSIRVGEKVGYEEHIYETKDAVYEMFVDGIIRGSGTGLSFADKSE